MFMFMCIFAFVFVVVLVFVFFVSEFIYRVVHTYIEKGQGHGPYYSHDV